MAGITINATAMDLSAKGSELAKKGDLEGALDCFQRAKAVCEQSDSFFTGWNGMAYVLFEMGKYKEALEAYKKAIEACKVFGKEEDLQYLYYRCANCMMKTNDWNKQLEFYATEGAKGADIYYSANCYRLLAMYYNNETKEYFKSMDCCVASMECSVKDYIKNKDYKAFAINIACDLYNLSLSHQNVNGLDYCEKHLLMKALEYYEKSGVEKQRIEEIKNRIGAIGWTLIPNKTKAYKRAMKLLKSVEK